MYFTLVEHLPVIFPAEASNDRTKKHACNPLSNAASGSHAERPEGGAVVLVENLVVISVCVRQPALWAELARLLEVFGRVRRGERRSSHYTLR